MYNNPKLALNSKRIETEELSKVTSPFNKEELTLELNNTCLKK
jgi:hypothetical protein